LTDRALIDIIRKRTREHRSPSPCASMSATASATRCGASGTGRHQASLENHGAEISQATLAYPVDQSTTVDEFRKPLPRRHDSAPILPSACMCTSRPAARFHPGALNVDRAELDATLAQVTTEALGATAENHVDAAQALAGCWRSARS
jgi:hypothetical protein